MDKRTRGKASDGVRGKPVAAAPLFLAGVLGFVGLRPIWDVDVFWHVVAGRWILREGALPSVDVFSFREPAPAWFTFQWLYEVVCAAVDGAGGLFAVRLFHGLVLVAAMVSFAFFAGRYTASAVGKEGRLRQVLALVFVVLMFVLYSDRVRARPHVFNLLFWSLSLHVLLLWRGRLMWQGMSVGAVMFFWSNLHGGGSFIFLLAALAFPGAATALALVNTQGGLWHGGWSVRRWWALWGVMAAACLASPLWVRGVLQAHAMMAGSEVLIDEWLPFWHYFAVALHPLHFVCGATPVIALAVLVTASFAPVRKHLGILLFCVAATLLPFRSGRFVFHNTFVLVLLSPIVWAWLAPRVSLRVRHMSKVFAVGVSLVMLVAALHYHSVAQFGSLGATAKAYESDLDERRFPVELDDAVEKWFRGRAMGGPLEIFCLPNWGGYLLYRHFPRIRVLADGRGNFTPETGRKLHFLSLYRHDPRFGSAIERIYDDSGATVLVMQQPVFPLGYRPAHWHLVYGTRKGAVWTRKQGL